MTGQQLLQWKDSQKGLMNGQNTVAVEGFKEGAQDESTTVAARANNSHKDHITGKKKKHMTGQQLLQS